MSARDQLPDPNAHVKSACEAYLALPVSPRYAVLIDGVWGSGKTHFINGLVAEYIASEHKAVLVSLYGLNATSQIDKEIYAQLHPVLGSSSVRFLGSLVARVASATISLPGDLSLDISAPTLELESLAEMPQQCLVIFDDLERCEIPIRQVLGYVNSLTEIGGLKVVVCVNEPGLGERIGAFQEQREKVFGQVLRLKPNADAAIKSFLRDIPDSLADVLRRRVPLRDVFREVGHENLRALRQSMLLFDRLYQALPDRAREDDEFLGEFLRVYLVLSLENAKTQIDGEFIVDLFGQSLREGSSDPPPRGIGLRKRLSSWSSLQITHQPVDVWEQFFVGGQVDPQKIQDLVSSHPRFQSAESPNWRKLWWWWGLTQSEFESVSAGVLKELANHEIKNVYVMVHATSTILELAHKGFVGIDPQQWVNECASYFEALTGEDAFTDRQGELALFLDFRHGYAGLGYPRDLAGYDTIISYADRAFAKVKQLRNERFAQKVRRLLSERDVDGFEQALDQLSNRHLAFPVFSFLDSKEIFDLLLKLPTVQQWQDVVAAIDTYFERGTSPSDRQFLDDLWYHIEQELPKRKRLLVREGLELLQTVITKNSIAQVGRQAATGESS